MQFQDKEIQLDTLKIHTESFGNSANPACLLIAGAMASARSWSDAFCQTLADHGYFIIRYDHRDVGESSHVDWKKTPYGLLDLASDAIGILDHYKIKQAHFVGHSMGGHICQKIALEYPKQALSLTAIASGPIGATSETDQPLTDEEKQILDKTWEIFLSRKDGASTEATIESFLSVWRYLNGSIPFDEEMAREYTQDLLVRSQHKIAAGNNHELVMRNLELDKYRNILKNIEISTLIIHGEQDPLALPRDGKALAHAIPKAHLALIPKMGHMFFNRKLEIQIIDLLINHFSQCSNSH